MRWLILAALALGLATATPPVPLPCWGMPAPAQAIARGQRVSYEAKAGAMSCIWNIVTDLDTHLQFLVAPSKPNASAVFAFTRMDLPPRDCATGGHVEVVLQDGTIVASLCSSQRSVVRTNHARATLRFRPSTGAGTYTGFRCTVHAPMKGEQRT